MNALKYMMANWLRLITDLMRIVRRRRLSGSEIIARDMKLTNEDLAEMLPSGKQSTFSNRVSWARTYLDKAGLIEAPSRGKYRITEEGKNKFAFAYLALF